MGLERLKETVHVWGGSPQGVTVDRQRVQWRGECVVCECACRGGGGSRYSVDIANTNTDSANPKHSVKQRDGGTDGESIV